MGSAAYDGDAAEVLSGASQRAVMRSLALQVSNLQLRLEYAAEERLHLYDRLRLLGASDSSPLGATWGADDGPAPWQLLPLQAPPLQPPFASEAHLPGLLLLLKQQLKCLDGVQQQLATSLGASTGATDPSSLSLAAAVLSSELPALWATVSVIEAEVQHNVAVQEASAVPAASQCAADEPVLCLAGPMLPQGVECTAPSASSSSQTVIDGMAARKQKWKARCKEMQGEAAARAAVVLELQQRVEHLAAAGSQLESALGEAMQQLGNAAGTAVALQQQLHRQQQGHQFALHDVECRAAAAEVRLQSWQQHA